MCTNHRPEAYKAIKLWGENLGSYPYYIKSEQQKAAKDGAPVDSLYFSHTLKRWIYVRDLAANHRFHAQYAQVV